MKLISVLRNHFSGTQVFIFVPYSSIEVRVLQSSRREVQGLGQRKDRVSISYFDVRFSFDLKYVLFRRKYDLSAIWNTPFIIPGAKSLFTLQISVASFYKFLWWTVNPLNASFALISKPVTWFAVQIKWLVSIWGKHWHLMG